MLSPGLQHKHADILSPPTIRVSAGTLMRGVGLLRVHLMLVLVTNSILVVRPLSVVVE
ncbi:MAG: hypothetical protein Roseis2KO_46930 [Roseivirga sp.]